MADYVDNHSLGINNISILISDCLMLDSFHYIRSSLLGDGNASQFCTMEYLYLTSAKPSMRSLKHIDKSKILFLIDSTTHLILVGDNAQIYYND